MGSCTSALIGAWLLHRALAVHHVVIPVGGMLGDVHPLVFQVGTDSSMAFFTQHKNGLC